ncbi:fungal-specific transcription factor domain-containing protein [Russula emetica]|nr:fungal-specific transcription factor domain-containing protein [Russula emetica]
MSSPVTPDKGSMLPPPPPATTASVEYKKDGTISRMRSHRGNVPQLPQTKLCPFCPAKFTRTTHLNRHLRNHTNERLYRCEVCGAQFTRSDLLARHKRSCGESHPISRSRKRSCQACTSLKVKCDLRQPCSKCRARGRDCVYATEEGQRDGAVGASNLQQAPNSRPPVPIVNLDASAGFDTSVLGRGTADAFATAFPELSLIEETSNAISHPLSEANLASFVGGAPRFQGAMSLPTIDTDSDITGSSFRIGGPKHAFTSFGASGVAGHSRALHGFSPTMFQPFFRDVFSVKEEPSQENGQGAAPLLDAPDAEVFMNGVDQPDFTQSSPNGVLDANLDRSLMSDLMSNVYIPMSQLMPEPSQVSLPTSSSLPAPPSAPLPNPQPMYSSNPTYDPSKPPLYTQKDLEPLLSPQPPIDVSPPDPSTEELQHYLLVFLTAFLPQIPVIHTPTLRFEIKPQVFIRAMQACGAIFIKTPVAQAFVEKTLGTCRNLIRDFDKPSLDPKYKSYINVTLLLLQTIGLFHQDPQQRAQSSINHGIVVQMVRRTRLIEQSTSWEHQVLPIRDPATLDAIWHEWAVHESIKRLVCLAYCHDQAHPIYFSLPSLFSPDEFVTCLPCDDELWAAKTSIEWSQLLLRPSPYGNIEERMCGAPMLRALAAVGLEGPNMTATSTEPAQELGAVSPFGHYILLQSLLGELFRRCTGADSPAATHAEEEVNEHVLAMQLALHRWLQMWLKTPNANPNENLPYGAESGKKSTGHFMADPLPFYWLAQLLLLAFQDGLPPFHRRETPPPCTIDTPNSQGFNEPSPFAPSTPASSPFSPSLFAPSPFSCDTMSSGSSPVLPQSPPPAYWSSSAPPPPPGKLSFAGTPGTGGAKVMLDTAQFYLIKRWLHYIRLFLRRNEGTPTVVWDELMKIRLSGWLGNEDASSGKYQQYGNASSRGGTDEGSGSWLEGDGLIGFFEEKLHV